MVTAERQATSRLIALDAESGILGYTHTGDPKSFLRELGGGAKPSCQVRIYEVCPAETDDINHYYDFEAICLLQWDPSRDSQD